MTSASILLTVLISAVMDVLVVMRGPSPDPGLLTGAAVFNLTTVFQAGAGAVIEWRRPGHAIGRLLLIIGPLYALLAAGWTTGDQWHLIVGPTLAQAVNGGGAALSWAGVALMAGWLPLLYPTGSLPGPRWRLPAGVIAMVGTAGVVAGLFRPGSFADGAPRNPFGVEGWPIALQPLVDAVPVALLALVALAIAGLAVRYRRGDAIERLQVRWLLAAVSIVAAGFAGVLIEWAIRTDDGAMLSGFVVFAGFLLMPIAIGMAILRYRLYEVDRIVSRGVAYAALSAILLAAFWGSILVLQPIVATVTGGETIAVALSTLAVATLAQPLRRRIQRLVDRRFNRARVDADLASRTFASRLRDEVDIDVIGGELRLATRDTLDPAAVDVWIRPLRHPIS